MSIIATAYRRYLSTFHDLSREVWLLSLVMLINRTGMMVLPFLSVYLNKSLGFSLKETGIVMTFFGLGSIAGAWLGGYLTDVLGFIKVQLLSLLLASGMFILLLQTQEMVGFCILLFITSLFTDMFRPANLAAIRAFSKVENRTRSLSLIRMAVNLGFAIGPAVAGLLITMSGYPSIFYVNCIAMLFAAAMLYAFFSRRKARNAYREVADDEDNRPRKSVFTDRPFLLLLFSMILTVTAFIQLLSTIPIHFKELGYNEDSIGLFMAFNCMLIVIFEMPLIFILEKRHSLPVLMALGAIFIALGYLSLNLLPWTLIAILLYLVGISFGEIVTFPTANSQALTLAGSKNAGRYMGMFTMTFSVSFAIAPAIGMFVAEEFGFHTLWYLSALLSLAGAAGFLWLRKGPQFSLRRQTA